MNAFSAVSSIDWSLTSIFLRVCVTGNVGRPGDIASELETHRTIHAEALLRTEGDSQSTSCQNVGVGFMALSLSHFLSPVALPRRQTRKTQQT